MFGLVTGLMFLVPQKWMTLSMVPATVKLEPASATHPTLSPMPLDKMCEM